MTTRKKPARGSSLRLKGDGGGGVQALLYRQEACQDSAERGDGGKGEGNRDQEPLPTGEERAQGRRAQQQQDRETGNIERWHRKGLLG